MVLTGDHHHHHHYRDHDHHGYHGLQIPTRHIPTRWEYASDDKDVSYLGQCLVTKQDMDMFGHVWDAIPFKFLLKK